MVPEHHLPHCLKDGLSPLLLGLAQVGRKRLGPEEAIVGCLKVKYRLDGFRLYICGFYIDQKLKYQKSSEGNVIFQINIRNQVLQNMQGGKLQLFGQIDHNNLEKLLETKPRCITLWESMAWRRHVLGHLVELGGHS